MLEVIGIAPQDETVLRALLATPHSTVAEIASSTGLGTDSVSASAHALEIMGCLTRTPDRPARLVPVRPDTAIDALVAQRRLELDRVSSAGMLPGGTLSLNVVATDALGNSVEQTSIALVPVR